LNSERCGALASFLPPPPPAAEDTPHGLRSLRTAGGRLMEILRSTKPTNLPFGPAQSDIRNTPLGVRQAGYMAVGPAVAAAQHAGPRPPQPVAWGRRLPRQSAAQRTGNELGMHAQRLRFFGRTSTPAALASKFIAGSLTQSEGRGD